MAIFRRKPGVIPFGKKFNFSTFWTSGFYSLERRFFVLEYRKRHFPGLYCLKKKVEKMAIFGPKPWVNPFGKMSVFSTFLTSCFYSLERRFFVVKYRKRHFPGLYCPKKKWWKNSHFWTKTVGYPFGKISIFRLFELLVFIASKGVFSF